MTLVKGQKVRITLSASWFDDTEKIGTIVGMCGTALYMIYITDSRHCPARDEHGNKYTWVMSANQFEPLGQVQLLFSFMETSYEV